MGAKKRFLEQRFRELYKEVGCAFFGFLENGDFDENTNLTYFRDKVAVEGSENFFNVELLTLIDETVNRANERINAIRRNEIATRREVPGIEELSNKKINSILEAIEILKNTANVKNARWINQYRPLREFFNRCVAYEHGDVPTDILLETKNTETEKVVELEREFGENELTARLRSDIAKCYEAAGDRLDAFELSVNDYVVGEEPDVKLTDEYPRIPNFRLDFSYDYNEIHSNLFAEHSLEHLRNCQSENVELMCFSWYDWTLLRVAETFVMFSQQYISEPNEPEPEERCDKLRAKFEELIARRVSILEEVGGVQE